MPKDLTREDAPVGTVVFVWEVNEYEQYNRGLGWYLIMAIIAMALLVYALLTTNYLFALIIVLFGIILYLHDMQSPLRLPFAITTTGIILGRRFYRYSELKNFWIIYQPGQVKNLYFSPNSILRHRLVVPLFDNDPLPIRNHLLKLLPEDLEQEEEPFTDRLARILKLY